jgi:hypothetical protein
MKRQIPIDQPVWLCYKSGPGYELEVGEFREGTEKNKKTGEKRLGFYFIGWDAALLLPEERIIGIYPILKPSTPFPTKGNEKT